MIADSRPPFDDAHPTRRRRILGVRVDDVSWDEALSQIGAMAVAGGGHYVVTPNPEMVMAARADETVRDAIEAADLATADGVGLRWAGARLGQPLRAVIPGSSLTLRLAEQGARSGQRWFLLGAGPGVAKAAAQALVADHPGLRIAGTFGGTPRPEDDAAVCAVIRAAGPIDILLVAYGSPAQELWLARNARRLPIGVAIGVGGTFDFLAGKSAWPPRWVKRMGLIWLWRLVREPWRWRRQLRLVRFVGTVVRERVRGR